MARSRLDFDQLIAWSPLAILGALAALTYWLDSQVSRLPAVRDASLRHDPNLIVEKLTATELGTDGRVEHRLTAAKAQHFSDDLTTEFERLTFVSTEPGKPRLEVAADRGKLTGDRENVYFYGNVRAVRESAGPDQPVQGPLTLVTEYLHVMPRTQRLSSDRPVTISEPRAIIRGTGLEYDHDARTLRLLSNVSGEFTPPKK